MLVNGEMWIRGPIGTGAEARVTLAGCRTALVIVPTLTAGTRLLDIVPLLESDHRVQVVFTVPHTTDQWPGVEEFVRARHGLLMPWAQAVHHTFDLVLAASHRHLEQIRGPVLLVGHGAGTMKSYLYSRKAETPALPATGLDRELLTYRGRILPSALALATEEEREALGSLCPEALPVAVVAGDICLDRMIDGGRFREHYRRALGVKPRRRLVTISSTWSTDSVFGRVPGLCKAILDALPATRYSVAAVLHPNVWTVHGRRQVTAWLSDCVEAGLRLIPPDHGWQATMVASDWVIGDHGSTTAYAAAIGCPVTMAAEPGDRLRPGSIADLVREAAPTLEAGPLPAQEEAAIRRRERLSAVIGAAISSRPGQAAGILRSAMYRLLGLPEPECPPMVPPLPVPLPVEE
ncbi:hypothetical protein [Amycolatopsis keratiniphila]|uniref:UDP-N-acetylglucosamine 2-epimerase domain-containing protein n=1 Tax=Amycolatopsis keratiniphila TaxID=129921 RepID=R4SQ14_9PSEU|nr:hypothetical protein [Amycolatopsis keratiniphila]AGM04735.1 hypothetical protein AORI_2147 [Amycolatopsis keratiniphila]